ncbi:hypothetical protein NEOC65_000099 [Neochlamydia sp. AcF65]|nr:hypothetical protein [Neochlamydia sp. AcF65]MBS4169646.1 hypothetical protein [Neochlamydia sp. AcF95]
MSFIAFSNEWFLSGLQPMLCAIQSPVVYETYLIAKNGD